jgi:hypothetical protein
MIVGPSGSFMSRIELQSAAGAAIAMAVVALEATAATTTEMRVTGMTIHHARIPSICHCLHQPTITVKKTRGLPEATGLCGMPP